MDMTGERRIPAPRKRVWDALNDPEVLKACIPNCESVEQITPTELKAAVAVKVGPISSRFTGKINLTDLNPPTSYKLQGEGQGGVAGFAKGGAAVTLSDDGPGTILAYEVHAQVGGKLAQLGSRLIDATAKQQADIFFDRFAAAVGGAEAGAPLPPPAQISLLSLIPREYRGLPLIAWVGIVIYAAIFILMFGHLL